MKKRTGRKLRERTGASMILALGIMLVVSVVCVSMLKVASTAPQEAYAQQDQEQAYLAATSAAKLLKAAFNSGAGNDLSNAVKILRAVESAVERGDSSCTLNFRLTRDGFDSTRLSAINTVLTVPITLTKAGDQKSVSAQINAAAGTGYPIPLPFEVYTAEIISQTYTYDEEGNITSTNSVFSGRKMYPLGYTKANAANDLLQYGDPEANNYKYKYYDYREPSETSLTPAELTVTPWQVIWRDHNNRVVKCVPLGTTTPTTEQINAVISSQSPSSYTETYDDATTIYDFASWKTYTTDTAAQAYNITANYTPYQKWQVIWLNYDNSTTRHTLYLADKHTAATASALQEISPVDSEDNNAQILPQGENPTLYYTFNGWNWAGKVVDGADNVRTITVSPSYTTETRHRMIWLNADGSTLQSKDYGNTAPADPAVPSKDSNSTYFHYVGSWGTGVESNDENGVPVITKKPEYKVIANKSYNIVWLKDTGNAPGNLDTATSTANQEEPTTDKIPIRIDANQFYPFTGWDSGVMDEVTNIKTYTPTFGEGQMLHTIIWRDADGRELKREYYGEVVPADNALTYPEPTPPSATEYYSYSFKEWVKSTDGNTTTFTASYNTTVLKYTVRWMDGSHVVWNNSTDNEEAPGIVLQKSDDVTASSEPEFMGSNPTHSSANTENGEIYFYTFSAWDSGTMDISGEMPVKTYTPQFSDTGTQGYTVIWYSDTEGDTIFEKKYYAENPGSGVIALETIPSKEGYTFVNWGNITPNGDYQYYYRPSFTENTGAGERSVSGGGNSLE